MGYVLNHMLDYVLDYTLDYMIIGLVTMALQSNNLLAFLQYQLVLVSFLY